MKINQITLTDLRRMNGKEGLILQGCGGETQEWVDGINKMLTDKGILLDNTKFENVSVFKSDGVTCILYPFENVLKKGSLEVVKTSEDNFNEGVEFHLYGTSLSGASIDLYATTNADGIAKFENVLVSGDKPYTLEEVNTADRYVVPKTQRVVIEWNKVTKKEVENKIIRGSIKGLKIDNETKENIAGALFGMFKAEEKELSEKTAILTAESNEEGIFTFENVPYGEYIVRELKPAEGYLPNEENYQVTISNNEEIIEITVENDKIPELKTTATIDGKKEVGATEVFTLEDLVEYKHLVPGKEYTVKGILMDKTTGDPLLIDEKEIPSETTFTPDEPSGEVLVSFEFDARYIKEDTDIVVFESLYSEDKELAVHSDIEDESQTVTVKLPKIGTKASIEGKKEFTANGDITIDDVVSYKNLTVGKEYTVSGVLMDKSTGKAFLVDGKEVCSEVTFTPETADGEVTVSFTFDGSIITKDTDAVVFESLYYDGVEIAVHADIEDENQTVTIHPQPEPEKPQTGDDSNLGFYIGLGSVAVGGLIAFLIIKFKRKDEDDE